MILTQINRGHGFTAFHNRTTNPVLLSPAKQAILRAKEGNTAKCWGCAGDHSWYDRVLKKVVCPNGNNPDCIKKLIITILNFLRKGRRSTRSSN